MKLERPALAVLLDRTTGGPGTGAPQPIGSMYASESESWVRILPPPLLGQLDFPL